MAFNIKTRKQLQFPYIFCTISSFDAIGYIMKNTANIQINHTVQTKTQKVIHNQTPKDTSLLKLITLTEFRKLFNLYSPALSKTTEIMYLKNADLFWNHFFGHIGWAQQHGINKKAICLTEESAHMILQNYEKFVSGFDFYNKPRGFLMVKNPETGIVDVLHYNSYLHEIQKESPVNYLAINFDSADSKKDDNNVPCPFEGEQKTWYEALEAKRILDNGQEICTKQELESAFIQFSQTIQNMGLKFYQPNFTDEFLNNPLNPIVLLARWQTALHNRHLKNQDREIQWKVMLKLRLENGDEAIRALSDFEKDANPCGFLLPEMNLTNNDFYKFKRTTAETKDIWGFRSITDPTEIEDTKDFWRYISFQPHRQSIKFYQDSLKAIQDITLISNENKVLLMRMLAGATTKFNTAKNLDEENEFLRIWQDICAIINRWETMNPLAAAFARITSDDVKSEMRNNLVHHLCRLKESPNIFWLNMMFGHIKHFFSNTVLILTQPEYLTELSDKLNYIVSNLKMSVYKGSKFLYKTDRWITTGIKDYVELQHSLIQTANPIHKLLAAHLSTFNISKINIDEYKRDINNLHIANQELLIFTLKLLEDIQTNSGLQWSHLLNICQAIKTKHIKTEIEVLDYLEQNLPQAFEENYFTLKKQQVLLAHHGLSAELIAFIDRLNFTPEQAVEVKRILSKIKSNIPLTTESELQNLVMKFNDFTHTFTSSDFTKFLINLANMSSAITSLEEINDLLNILLEKRKFTDFEHIYFRNMIVKNSENLIVKFSCYISNMQTILDEHPTLNPYHLHSMLATYILNINDNEDLENLSGLLQKLEQIIAVNPHIENYIFLSLQNIPGNNTPEFIQNTLNFGNTLLKIHNILSEQNATPNVQNMQIFYTIMAKYAKDPEACINLFTTLGKTQLEPDKIKFIINILSKLLEKNEPLTYAQKITELIISLNSEQYQQFVECYTNHPYPPLETWIGWTKEPETLSNKYSEFTLNPFGPRILKYTFDLNHYHKQKNLFQGLIKNETPFSSDILTEELGRKLQTNLMGNRQKSVIELQQIFEQTTDTIEMMCAAIELLARTTSQKDLISDKQISQEMNTTQVMAVYLALTHPTAKLQMEMDTGEGKSRVLMILAACKAKLGYTADFSTSDIQLAERDYFTYKSFFTTLNISTSLITLSTPELLYQHKGVNFTDNEQLQLARNKSDIDDKPFAFLNSDSEQRCLLQDEIDKFKKDKSKYACNYASTSIKFGEFTWIYPHLVQFMLHNDHRTSQLQTRASYKDKDATFLKYIATNDSDPTRVAQLSVLCNLYPEQLSTWLYSADLAIKKMKLNHDFAITDQVFPIIDGEGNMRSSQKVLVLNNGRPAEGALFSDGLHQCILALLNIKADKEQFVIPPEVETQRTSYPINFINKYDNGQTIGASGTTRSTGPITDPRINYEDYGYLLIPRDKALKRENKNIWAAKDKAQQIEFIKSELIKKLAKGLPALIICKDDNQSLDLYNALSTDPKLQATFTRVHGLTTPEDEKIAIQKAGIPKQITISTAGMFSRGVDIEADNLYVVAAYVPTLEDEIQIMGRTARAGKPGEYRMIPDLSDKDTRLNGKTHNIYNEVEKYQKNMAVEAEFQESVSVIYSTF